MTIFAEPCCTKPVCPFAPACISAGPWKAKTIIISGWPIRVSIRRKSGKALVNLRPLLRGNLNGNIFAVIFFLTRALSVEWIRFLITFLDRIYRIKGIFFACGEIPKGRRPFYLNNPVNPACPVKSFLPLFHWGLIFFFFESIPQILRSCIYESMFLAPAIRK